MKNEFKIGDKVFITSRNCVGKIVAVSKNHGSYFYNVRLSDPYTLFYYKATMMIPLEELKLLEILNMED